MIDLTEAAQTLGWLGGGLGASVWGLDRLIRALATLEAAPSRLKQWGTRHAEGIVLANTRAENVNLLADKADLILAAVTPNGGTSLMDAVCRIEGNVARIEGKLDEHIEASDKVEARVYADMAELGGEVDVLRRNMRDLSNRERGIPTEGI